MPPTSAATEKAKRSEFIGKVKFRNTLPDLPYDAKCLELPFDTERFVDYQMTTLERQHKHQLYTELEMGIPIDLIDPQAYAIPEHAELDPEDLELLKTDTSAKKVDPRTVDLPWLMKTTYISNDYDAGKRTTSGFERQHGQRFTGAEISKEELIKRINASFDAAKEAPVHPTKPELHAVEVFPVLPDIRRAGYQQLHVTFDEAPTTLGQTHRNIAERLQSSVLVGTGILDADQQDNEPAIALLLPAPDAEARGYDKDAEDCVPGSVTGMEYQQVRQYRYEFDGSFKEESFLFVLPADNDPVRAVVYERLERLKLHKRKRGPDLSRSAPVLVLEGEMKEEGTDAAGYTEKYVKRLRNLLFNTAETIKTAQDAEGDEDEEDAAAETGANDIDDV
eukprot:TRINITY_DN14520_c0_g1_i1.p1 TRINITY_DN14520_c0_g1~~TRINITY_DN14520_c0_g1_i1.p1  ORF type:complete len:392 (+),score=86.61 TRINITY_DN14520_c0_g1_i1:50-1225(+)